MTLKKGKNKNSVILLTIIVILVVTISLLATNYFSQSNGRLSAEITINQTPKQSTSQESVAGINETNSLNATSPLYNTNSTQLEINTTSSATLSLASYKVQYVHRIFSPPNRYLDQTAQPDLAPPTNETNTNETSTLNEGNSINNTSPPLNLVPILLNESDFTTYTYSGYSVQQATSTQFIFPFPNCTDQGQIAGSDALTVNNFTIQKLDFDATFIAPSINALGFDEMAIFATSNTDTYKGTEFGVRMDLMDGFICCYVQESNESSVDVNFKMMQLMPNDGLMHHYTLNMTGSEVSFYIDGVDVGHLNFPSNTDYSNLKFSICAVVHRFTDGWDSTGNSMIAGNFSLNQQ